MHAFCAIEDVRFVSEGIFPVRKPWFKKIICSYLGIIEKKSDKLPNLINTIFILYH